jgi:hypothetical protein
MTEKKFTTLNLLTTNLTVELLHISHFHHVSLVQWTNRLLPATGGSNQRQGGGGGANHTSGTGIHLLAPRTP